jgi:NADP-dependent 3-hydroxy acid dehydrogenase YdfG
VSVTLEGRRILVTGGSSGIGAAVAASCGAAGARVAVLGRDAQRLAEVAERTGAHAIVCDVSDRDAVPAAVADAVAALGGLDGLVNNAGVMGGSLISEGRYDDWATMLNINVLGLLSTTSAALPHLRAAGSADVINVSSRSGDRLTMPEFALYGASKAAVNRITEALRAELSGEGRIRVSVIKLGFTRTAGLGPNIHDEELRRMTEERKETLGLDPSVAGDAVCHMLGLPPGVCFPELTCTPVAD